MGLLQSPQEEETLVSLLDQGGGVEGPREILGDVDTQELKAGDTLNLCPVDLDGGVCSSFLPEVPEEFIEDPQEQMQLIICQNGTMTRIGM